MSIGKIRFDQRSLHFDSGGISLHILMKTKLFMRFVPVIHLLLFSYSHTVELKWQIHVYSFSFCPSAIVLYC